MGNAVNETVVFAFMSLFVINVVVTAGSSRSRSTAPTAISTCQVYLEIRYPMMGKRRSRLSLSSAVCITERTWASTS